MFTRALIYIIREKPIFLYVMMDGYFSCTGNTLCIHIKELLEKYGQEKLSQMVDALEVESLPDDKVQVFYAKDFKDFIERNKTFYSLYHNDVYYMYTIDFKHGIIIGEDKSDDILSITFENILKGCVFTDYFEDE